MVLLISVNSVKYLLKSKEFWVFKVSKKSLTHSSVLQKLYKLAFMN